MKTRLLFVPLLVAAVVGLAACGGGGGGSTAVPPDAVAVVGSTPITKTQFTSLMATVQAQDKATGASFPKVGTPQYTTLRDQVIAYLVQNSELQQEAAKMGVSVTDKDVNAYLKNVAKLNYGGSMKKLLDAIKKGGLSLSAAKYRVMVGLLGNKVKAKVTSKAAVSALEAKQYYDTNKSQYEQAAATTRQVAHILVKTKSLAEKIEKKLQNGANFAALAKQYSTDTGSAQNGGKLCIAKSGQSGSCIQTVPPFAKAAFALKTGAISPPVHSKFGWHVIKALGPVQHTKAGLTPFKKVVATIRQTLLAQQQQTLWTNFLSKLQKDFQGKVSYQVGYAPPATTSTPTTPVAPTTTG
jgi:foldase protein PrsA